MHQPPPQDDQRELCLVVHVFLTELHQRPKLLVERGRSAQVEFAKRGLPR